MPQWEYRKLNLNEVRRRSDDIDALCEAGNDGWELVSISLTNIAYLKREIATAEKSKARKQRLEQHATKSRDGTGLAAVVAADGDRDEGSREPK